MMSSCASLRVRPSVSKMATGQPRPTSSVAQPRPTSPTPITATLVLPPSLMRAPVGVLQDGAPGDVPPAGRGEVHRYLSGMTEIDTRALGRAFMDAFGKGWERAKVDEIIAGFAEDATFLDDPFAQPIQGKAAIRDYWKDVAYHQSEITFTPGEVFSAGPWFSTEFRVVY